VLDSGSGEGYYTDLVERAVFERDGTSFVSGFDISKEAVKRAAKKNPRIEYAVASSYEMPIADGAADTLYNVFSPLAIEESARVLKQGGRFIMVIPDEEHLFELKAAVYDTPYKNKEQQARCHCRQH
jgi:23S rRNA (guanine745-N1)-methyltransferase